MNRFGDRQEFIDNEILRMKYRIHMGHTMLTSLRRHDMRIFCADARKIMNQPLPKHEIRERNAEFDISILPRKQLPIYDDIYDIY